MNKAPGILLMMEALVPGSLGRILASKCPSCGCDIDPENDFKDEISRREFHISGLCQKCQDDIWK
jgi:hypothetical protein